MSAAGRFVTLSILAALLLGCGAAPAATEVSGATATTTSSPTPGVDASPTPGEATRAATPAIPAGMPIYPGAEEETPTAGTTARWATDADPPDVYDFFLEALPAAGFTVDAALPGGDAAIIRFTSRGGTAYQLDLTGHEPVSIVLAAPHD